MRIGIDLMGGDTSPQVLLDALLGACEDCKGENCSFVAIATHEFFSEYRPLFLPSASHIEFMTVSDAIEMEDSPLLAIRRKKNSSLSAGITLLKYKQIDAFVTTGNTGALVASAMLDLETLPGVKRAALLAFLPTLKGQVAAIDVGANLLCRKEHLVQFAHLAACYQKVVHNIEKPRIGLLNIGAEEVKGTKQVKEAYLALQGYFADEQRGIFIGNVEGRDLFYGICDVLVTDGFTGNVFLKTAEGVSSFLLDYLKDHKKSELLPVHFNYSHTGALLFGLDGVIIKCHGNANSSAVIGGIKAALKHVKNDTLNKIKNIYKK